MSEDSLRPPSPFDLSAPQYKDWLHLNILDHRSGAVGLVNVSLHGAPDDTRSRAVGTALVHVPDLGWIGQVEARGFDEAAIGASSIALERVALAVHHPSATVMASVRDLDHALTLRLSAKASAPRVVIDEGVPLGHGWISWYAVPRLAVTGEMTVCDRRIDLAHASAYHDHNWGRWFWGDDLGWEWGCFLAPAPQAAFVMSRTTDRAHRRLGRLSLVVCVGHKQRTFAGSSVAVEYAGVLDKVQRRVPGAMAALHQDRARPRLPKTVRLKAGDGVDVVTLEFTARAAVQLVTADPIVRGYGFIHELAGAFTCAGRLGDMELDATGLGMFEYVA